MQKNRSTSWQEVGRWYDTAMGSSGDRTHTSIVIPKTLSLLSLAPGQSLLDLACGQGVLARAIGSAVSYIGIDASPALIEAAQKRDHGNNHRYIVGDITKPYDIGRTVTAAACILAFDNIEDPSSAVKEASAHLSEGGRFVLVFNHPCFRIPRQSSWEIDERNKMEYRRINRYLSPLKIPITMHPGMGTRGPVTWTFHHSLSSITGFLTDNGFLIDRVEEWISEKSSVGKAAAMENRARSEFPLFLAIRAVKK